MTAKRKTSPKKSPEIGGGEGGAGVKNRHEREMGDRKGIGTSKDKTGTVRN